MARPDHKDTVHKTVESATAAASSLVAASWTRSIRYHGLDPEMRQAAERVEVQQLAEARQAAEQLLLVARPTLQRLLRMVGDDGCCVLLTNAQGVILERHGSASLAGDFDHWGLGEGAVWSEAAEGTNGIGTCLVEKRPVTIHRDQHFYARNTGLACMDAPIFDHQGRLAAALDLSSCRRDQNEAMSNLLGGVITDAARRIEADHFQAAFPGKRIIVGQTDPNGAPVLLAVDKDDLVVGATRAARQVFGLDDGALASPRPATDILNTAGDSHGLDQALAGEIRRALARAGGNASAAARALGIGRATLYRRMKQLGIDPSGD
jgi:transcriptional regulator of acetoin/glycerol metabolism